MSIVIWTTVFAVATAFWFSACWCVHFRWDADIRSRWREMISLPTILGASALGRARRVGVGVIGRQTAPLRYAFWRDQPRN